MNQKQFLNDYEKFVESVMSKTSLDWVEFKERLDKLGREGREPSLLLTAEIGLSGETGEFSDIIKKIMFQGKEFTDEVHDHLSKELSDIIFYWITACLALNVDPNDIIQKNIDKLSARYPNGFEVSKSEVRSDGDI